VRILSSFGAGDKANLNRWAACA